MAGCGSHQHNHQENEAPEFVKLGVIAPLSGPAAAYGTDAVNVYQDRVAAFNAEHKEVQVELIVEDGKCEGKDAASAAQKLLHIDKIDALLGGWCSSETMTAGPLAQAQGVVALAALSSAPEIAEIGSYVYRFWNDTVSAKRFAKYMNGKYDNLAIFYEKNDIAQQALYQTFLKYYEGNTVLEVGVDSAEKDYDILIQKMKEKQAKVQGVVIIGKDEFTLGLLKSLQKNDLLTTFQSHIFGFYQMASAEIIESLGTGTLEGMKQVNVNMSLLG